MAIFVHGCFWHGCPKCRLVPKTHTAFWAKKFITNRSRDRARRRLLKRERWAVVEIWEHEVMRELPIVVAQISNLLGRRRREPKVD